MTTAAAVVSEGLTPVNSDRSVSPVPNTVNSSASEQSFEITLSPGKAGDIPPNTICQQRSLSAVVVTHETVEQIAKDRPKILMPRLHRAQTVPTDTHRYASVTTKPLRLEAWSEPAAEKFSIRSKSYLRDSRKTPSDENLFKLLTVDIVNSPQPNYKGMCAHPQERIQKALREEQERGVKMLPEFIFAVNLCIPASSAGAGSSKSENSCFHSVFYFGIEDKDVLKDPSTAVGRVCKQFFFGPSDEYRDATFKLIPRIVEGNFVVRKAVGSKPALLGTKLKQYYIRTDRFCEVIVDIGSDSVATRVVKVALGYAKSLTVDMMFLFEGVDEKTLPERILGGVRIKSVDFKKRDGQRTCPLPP